MLQVHLLILLTLGLYSVIDLKLVVAEHNSSEPLPFPLFKNYYDFQNRSSEYNSSIYYYQDMEKEVAYVCERNIVVTYYKSDRYDILDYNERGPNHTAKAFEYDNYFKCIDCLTQLAYTLSLTFCRSNLQFPIVKYLGTVVFNLTATDRNFLTADKTIVQNFSNSTQTGMSTSYSKSVANTNELSFGFGLTLKAETKVKVPLVAEATVGFSFEGHFNKKNSETITTSVTAPAQTISLPARKQVTINYALYQTKLVNDCLLNFGIDDHGSAEDTQPFRFKIVRDRIHEGRSRVNFFPDKYGPGLKLKKNGEWHLHNYPAQETVQGHELHIIFGPEVLVHGSVEVGPNTHVIMMQPRSYKEKQ